MLDTCHVRVCRAQWPAVRDHPEGGGEQARHPPLVGVHLVLLLPHLRPGNGPLLVSFLYTFILCVHSEGYTENNHHMKLLC